MKIAVIGAGAAGLAAMRHSTSHMYNNEVICYEQTDKIGGTWVYKEENDVDQYGLSIHSSMYKNLRTNLPKEAMGYPDYPIPDISETYLSHMQIFEYLNSYCEHFKLEQYIRFLHHVELVKPSNGERKWLVKVKDLRKDITTIEFFDAVMICNGHYFKPNIPKIKGQDIFQGLQIHSHQYRHGELYRDKTIVIIGAGPSALDLTVEISKIAKRVILSHHLQKATGNVFYDNVVQKPDVRELTERNVVFEDNSSESVDVIFYCTGYEYSFPFLDESCGIRVDSNMVSSLWKHIVSIENPTLALIGIPIGSCAFSMFDIQVRFVLQFWCGKKKFPSKEDMLREEKEELRICTKKGLPKKRFHVLNEKQSLYYDDLAKIAGIETLTSVVVNIYNDCYRRYFADVINYRNVKYKVVDDRNFIKY